jgi:hypothetical protein
LNLTDSVRCTRQLVVPAADILSRLVRRQRPTTFAGTQKHAGTASECCWEPQNCRIGRVQIGCLALSHHEQLSPP